MPGADRDEESGQYTETYDDDDVLEAIVEAENMAGTQDVADHVGCSYEAAYKRLRRLEDEGAVKSQKIANARVWMLADDVPLDDSGPYDPSDEFQ